MEQDESNAVCMVGVIVTAVVVLFFMGYAFGWWFDEDPASDVPPTMQEETAPH